MRIVGAIGYVLWLLGGVLLGNVIAQLFMLGQVKFGILVSLAALFTLVGGAMKEDY